MSNVTGVGKTQIEKRNRALAAFNQWEAEHPRRLRNSEQIFACLGTLYALLPVEARRRIEDPDRNGIRIMHRALRHLKSSL